MKLKGLKPRLYNIMFHTHTVSGIVISFALFVIFYAGAFSLFREELYRWENPKARFETKKEINYDSILKVLKNKTPLLSDINKFTLIPPSEENPFIKFFSSRKTTEGKRKNISYYINPYTGESFLNPSQFSNPNSLTYMGETIYRLHYFRQIPVIGPYLSGLVGFFFLFAIITGVLIHWKNILNKFYSLTIKGSLKNIWTNSHTFFGFIALPFQFTYAVTGALLGVSILLLAPSAFLLYEGDTSKIVSLVRPSTAVKYDTLAEKITKEISINELYKKIKTKYPNHEVTRINASNYTKVDGTLLITVDDKKGVSGNGEFMYKNIDGNLVYETIPNKKTYTEGVYDMLIKLHYANYGGFFLKIIYFILAMITCYIIISGVLIWQKARDNKKYTYKQRKFHHRITKLYLAFCLSMFPAIALIFMANKIIPLDMERRVFYVKSIFFFGWLLLTMLGLFWNTYAKQNKRFLFLGSFMALLIPILNGFITGDWLWKTLMDKQYYVFSVDFSWLLAAVFGFIIYKSLTKYKINSEIEKK